MSKFSKVILNTIFSSLHSSGIWKIQQKLSPNVLTVLNYHRIAPTDGDSFLTFKSNVSASPEMFAAQMDYLKNHYKVISQIDLVKWFNGEQELPPNSALITFDDGYVDNYEYAFPIIKERDLNAIIFLTTDFIDRKMLFYWDVVAYCIYQTGLNSMKIPGVGDYSWQKGEEYTVIRNLVNELKYLPNEKKQSVVQEIIRVSGVTIPETEFYSLPMTWKQISEMAEVGIDFGAHTKTHPILTNIASDEAAFEIQESKKRIEAEIGNTVESFAYPNGQPGDFNAETIEMVQNSGYHLAFSLISGPSSYREAEKEQYAIRRIFLSHKDTLPRFAAKVNGLARFV